mmetsp:Transcript_28518/g.60759  ORF Transcript_28518/g.60759 Transcript_28518/m.60759 type:complete len:401 (+) Transcript_28518:129-1331(+)
MRTRLALVHSPLFIHPSAFPTHQACIGTLPPVIPLQIPQPKLGARHGSVVKLSSESTVHVPSERNDGTNKRIHWDWGLLKQRIQRFPRLFRKRGLPRSNTWAVPETSRALCQQAMKFFAQLILETFLVASAFALASTLLFAEVKSKFVIINLTRWMAASLFIKMVMFHSRISSTVPSLAREETTDWFLQGSYRVLLGDSNDNEVSVASSIPVRIRQVPGDGSCLFHAVAAGILYDKSTSNHNHEHDASKHLTHPPMSKVINYSSKLRTQAVDSLENGMKNNTLVVLQNDETISASLLVSQAATMYDITKEEYVSNMRQENVWGGGPEMVALANCLARQILLLETVNAHDENAIYLKEITRFGPPSACYPIYILSTNQKFPKDYGKKEKNHFLAVFPSQPF